MEVYKGDSRMWKENAEWKQGEHGKLQHRVMNPVEEGLKSSEDTPIAQ
jgi:hypothetical protein